MKIWLAKIKIKTVILAFLRNCNWCLKSVKHIILQSVNCVCGYNVVYSLTLYWPKTTKVPVIKCAKHTPNQVSKLVPHDMQQKPLMVSRLLTKLMHRFLFSLFIIFLIVCLHIPFYYALYLSLQFKF